MKVIKKHYIDSANYLYSASRVFLLEPKHLL